MPLGQVIVTNILISLGLCDPGGAPSASDSNDTLNEVNTMLDAWAAEETLVPSVLTGQYVVAANTNPVTIGTGATINIARPSRITKAVFMDSAGTRRPLRIVPADEYFEHGDLTASAVAPDQIYYDNADVAGVAKIYQWPVFSVASAKLELETWQPIGPLALAVNTPMQQSIQDAIQYGGAWRSITRFGIDNPAIIQKIEQLAKATEDRLRKQNVGVRGLSPDLLASPQAPPNARQ